ncbi:MAG: MarP family serine protease [Actinobacteria bacterium]|nr:MAG: MarP family serine protease [Actinomycetota bacterium]
MTRIDWLALAFVALMALYGLRKGLIASALSAAGVIGGAIVGARLAPHLLSGGSRSPYTPVAALGGAIVFAIVLEAVGSLAGATLRSGLRLPPLRALDSAGGFVLGAASGLAIVWVLGAAALLLPGQKTLRRDAQRSLVVRRLDAIAPPRRLLEALARVDPFPSIAGPIAGVAPPDPRLLRAAGVRAAAPSVVRVVGTACGLSVEGSGWVARQELVVTAAHVVAGEHDTAVQLFGTGSALHAIPVAVDARNDVAVLRVPGLRAQPLRFADPRPGAAVVLLGYPGDGPFDAKPGRIGRTVTVLSQDAYGHGPVARTITSVRGEVRHGDSGGPAVDAAGRVQTTIFAARVGSTGGYGVPPAAVRQALAGARGPVSTGPCSG